MDYFPAGRVSAMLRRLPIPVLRAVAEQVRGEVRRRETYFHVRKDVARYLPMALKPWIVTEAQRGYLRALAVLLESAALRAWHARRERPDLQALLPFTEDEERWIREAYGRNLRRPETLMSRCDVAVHLGRADWRRRLRLLEVNLVGVGAAYYSYGAGRIASEVLAPMLPVAGLQPEDDALEIIMARCREHGRKIGRRNPTVALVEYRRSKEGPHEYETMQRVYQDRGYRVVVADPVELDVRRGEVAHRGVPIDILYRDPTLLDFLWMERQGDDLRAVKLAFRRNQVVSSLAGEVDHKALLELLSSPRFDRLFPRQGRAFLRRHVPWTRVVRAERVDGVDLPAYIRRHRSSLVIKPNRDYGGKGIRIGAQTTAAQWDRLIDEGVRHPGRYVAQECLPFNRDDYPMMHDGSVRWESRYIVTGVHAGPSETALLGRMSEEPIVNITRGGAIVGVLRTS
ncbi:MAG: hypothetical protein HYY16_18585 [Planctomycetes bacterium]|nr:hypothetical protein [Planctomycetota bacterium]